MKKLILNTFIWSVVLCFAVACSNTQNTQGDGEKFFGEKIDEKGAQSMSVLYKEMYDNKKGEWATKVEGEVTGVCQVKGCWMTLKGPEGQDMRVRFKDYGFFMPFDLEGSTVVIDGVAKMDTTSIADLKHYAEDEGLPQEEIDKITEPEIAVTFLADGVMIK